MQSDAGPNPVGSTHQCANKLPQPHAAAEPNPDLKDIRILLRLQRCFKIMSSMGPRQLTVWHGSSVVTYQDAVKIKQTLKAQSEKDEWINVSKPFKTRSDRQTERPRSLPYRKSTRRAGLEG